MQKNEGKVIGTISGLVITFTWDQATIIVKYSRDEWNSTKRQKACPHTMYERNKILIMVYFFMKPFKENDQVDVPELTFVQFLWMDI